MTTTDPHVFSTVHSTACAMGGREACNVADCQNPKPDGQTLVDARDCEGVGRKLAEAQARRENAADLWDRMWTNPLTRDWREVALSRVYDRVGHYVKRDAPVIDLGGGVGALGWWLVKNNSARVVVVDHSDAALSQAAERGLGVSRLDLELGADHVCPVLHKISDIRSDPTWVVSTEFLEHLSARARDQVLSWTAGLAEVGDLGGGLFTVPNNRLGPDEEPQHTVKFTAISFKAELRRFFDHVRVEAHGPYLLGIVGPPAVTTTRLSMCLPVRDEEADLEAVLASFSGIASEIVVGIDPRTVDGTRAIAEAYADVVFELVDPACQDPDNPLHDAAVPPEGVHFSWIRNQCINRCSGDWVFMTEGHERLLPGASFKAQLDGELVEINGRDALLHLDQIIPAKLAVVYVTRRGHGQRWSFPWLHRNIPGLRYTRSTHNALTIPDAMPVGKFPQVETYHDRDHGNAVKRAGQREAQNRKTLWDDWEMKGNPTSLFYFAQEIRADDPEGAAERFEEFLGAADERNGQMRYQARLILARLYMVTLAGKARAEQKAKAEDLEAWRSTPSLREVMPEGGHSLTLDCREAEQRVDGLIELAERALHGCTGEDWSRTEHWLWLGDIAFNRGQHEQAYRFYSYAGTHAGRVPFTVWWVDEASYLWLPAQRLAMCAGHLSLENEALVWAKRALDLLPADAPTEALEEAARNITIIAEVITEMESAGAAPPAG